MGLPSPYRGFPSPSRVAARHLQALVVPFRRDREYAAYHAFLKRLRGHQKAVAGVSSLLEGDAADLFADAGAYNAEGWGWDGQRFLSRFERELGGRKDLPWADRPDTYHSDLHATRQSLAWAVEEEIASLRRFRKNTEEMAEALGSREFKDSLRYYDLTPREVNLMAEAVASAGRIPEEMELLLKRIERTKDTSGDEIPASAEVQDLETLYHASVDAKGLYQKGFSTTMPEASSSAGLGGSQSVGGGRKGISFTEDAYVAKEIARVFKEVVMVARGEVDAGEIIGWSSRSGKLAKVIEWYVSQHAGFDRFKERLVVDGGKVRLERFVFNEDHLREVKSGRAEYDPQQAHAWETAPFKEAFGGPVAAMGLYLSYLNLSGRYDPKFFGVGGAPGLVRRFKGLNPGNIGYIVATVNMTDPHITYGRGEREFRVPPEAVVSVDRFVS
jgi:hypothetical protein